MEATTAARVDAAQRRDISPHRPQRWIRHGNDGLTQRIVEIGAHDLKKKPQHDREDIQAEHDVDEKDPGVREISTATHASAPWASSAYTVEKE